MARLGRRALASRQPHAGPPETTTGRPRGGRRLPGRGRVRRFAVGARRGPADPRDGHPGRSQALGTVLGGGGTDKQAPHMASRVSAAVSRSITRACPADVPLAPFTRRASVAEALGKTRLGFGREFRRNGLWPAIGSLSQPSCISHVARSWWRAAVLVVAARWRVEARRNDGRSPATS